MKRNPTENDIVYRNACDEEQEEIARQVYKNYGKVMYEKNNDGTYTIYCPNCNQYHNINKSQFKLLRANHICPFCFSEINSTTKVMSFSEVAYYMVQSTFGYMIKVNFHWGIDKPFSSSCTQVMYSPKNAITRYDYNSYYGGAKELYARGIKCNSGHHIYPTFDNEWKYRCSDGYWCDTYDLDFVCFNSKYPKLRRLPLESFIKKNELTLKSNQKKLIIDNVDFTRTDIQAIITFDLKTREDVMLFRQYLNQDHYAYRDYMRSLGQLNIFFLNYLSQNKIKLNDYADYKRDLDYFNYKLDKPKDFIKRHEQMYKLRTEDERRKADEKKKEIIANANKKIKEIFPKLPTYSQSEVVIKPFESVEEMKNCGSTLSICIGGDYYIKRYSDMNCQLYSIHIKDKLIGALEISQDKLIQVRGKHNSRPNEEILNCTLNFCKQNNYEHSFIRG